MSASALMESATTDQQRAILHSLLAFAAGDAFGVAYEYLPRRVDVDIDSIGTRDDWPRGGVSDDTMLSLITILAVEPNEPEESASEFHREVLAAVPRLRGLGPTTRAALGLPPAPDEGLVVVGNTVVGNTNGGMMRTALLGLGYVPSRDVERRAMVVAMTRVTHKSSRAVACALACSAMFSRALAAGPEPIERTLRAEIQGLGPLGSELVGWLATQDQWQPPSAGIALDPLETLAAVVWVVSRSASVLDAFRIACEIGGDTDTVAALAGGLVAARSNRDDLLGIPWIDDVQWTEIPDIVRASERLTMLREAR